MLAGVVEIHDAGGRRGTAAARSGSRRRRRSFEVTGTPVALAYGPGSVLVFRRLPDCAPLRTDMILRLCYMKIDAPVSVYAGILTPRTGTTGAERSARFVPTARVGGQVAGRSCASSRS